MESSRLRVLVIINDRAGGGEAGLYDFLRYLGKEHAETVLRFATDEQPISDLVADAEKFDRVVAAGGDGTVSAVCYGVRSTGVPVLAYPAGTANLLAMNLSMPTEPPALRKVLLEGASVGFDLVELERADPDTGATLRSGFVIMAGAGYDAQIMRGAEPLKQALGPAAYFVAAVSGPAPKTAKFKLILDGKTVETDGIAVLLANFARIQFDVPVTPNSDPSDGVLEIAVMRTKTVIGLLPAFAAAMLDRVVDHPDRSASVDLYSASRIEVRSDPPLHMQADGDSVLGVTPFSAMVLPRAATLLVPEDSHYAAR
jgi:diacylglycerol kinase family enzyme